jgi:hypothetical protein
VIAVVGGHSRNAGKTSVICGLLRALPEARWTAIKLSPHAHPGTGGDRDTNRYLAAGAARARLATTPQEALETLAGAGHVLLESNRVLEVLAPDLYLFVVNAAEPFKPGARLYAARADAFILVGPTPPPLPGRRSFHVEPPGYISPELVEFVRRRL